MVNRWKTVAMHASVWLRYLNFRISIVRAFLCLVLNRIATQTAPQLSSAQLSLLGFAISFLLVVFRLILTSIQLLLLHIHYGETMNTHGLYDSSTRCCCCYYSVFFSFYVSSFNIFVYSI